MNDTMHLFAGAGGGLLADLILGKNPIIAVEWDKYACKVLRERAADGWFPDLSVWEGDIRLFDPSPYKGKVGCIHAGFPCQDISHAGKQAGVGEETRSGLYREVLRIADVVRPDELYLENVSAILSNGLGTVLADLSERGYVARWICLRASDVGANHGRDRWWLLARRSDVSPHAKHNGNGRGKQWQEGIEETTRKMGDTNKFRYIGQRNTKKLQDNSIGDIATLKQRRGRVPMQIKSNGKTLAYTTSIRQPRQRKYVGQIDTAQNCNRETNRIINSSERNEGWWQSEPGMGRVANGVADRVGKLKALGNGQVPLQAAVAYSILEELFNE